MMCVIKIRKVSKQSFTLAFRPLAHAVESRRSRVHKFKSALSGLRRYLCLIDLESVGSMCCSTLHSFTVSFTCFAFLFPCGLLLLSLRRSFCKDLLYGYCFYCTIPAGSKVVKLKACKKKKDCFDFQEKRLFNDIQDWFLTPKEIERERESWG